MGAKARNLRAQTAQFTALIEWNIKDHSKSFMKTFTDCSTLRTILFYLPH
jgi:hypothetical protein